MFLTAQPSFWLLSLLLTFAHLLVVLGIEPRVLPMLDKCFTDELYPYLLIIALYQCIKLFSFAIHRQFLSARSLSLHSFSSILLIAGIHFAAVQGKFENSVDFHLRSVHLLSDYTGFISGLLLEALQFEAYSRFMTCFDSTLRITSVSNFFYLQMYKNFYLGWLRILAFSSQLSQHFFKNQLTVYGCISVLHCVDLILICQSTIVL